MRPVTESVFGLFLWLFAITVVVATIAAQGGFYSTAPARSAPMLARAPAPDKTTISRSIQTFIPSLP